MRIVINQYVVVNLPSDTARLCVSDVSLANKLAVCLCISHVHVSAYAFGSIDKLLLGFQCVLLYSM